MKLFILLITISVTLAAVLRSSDDNNHEQSPATVAKAVSELKNVESVHKEDSFLIGTADVKRVKREPQNLPQTNFWNAVPIVSQIKSAIQAMGGDLEGAKKTQNDFTMQYPLLSQFRSAIEAASGDAEAAKRTQLQFLGGLNNFVDSVPLVGHMKGVAHIAAGDNEGGQQAIMSATRGTGVLLASTAGAILGGPAGAAAAGAAAGAGIDAAFYEGTNKQVSMGIYEPIDRVEKHGLKGTDIYETILVPVADAFLPGPANLVVPSVPSFGSGSG